MRTCEVDGCDRQHLARGLCSPHYQAWRADATDVPRRPCSVEGCERPFASRGYCATHARNWRATGDPIATSGKGVHHPRWRADHAVTYGGAHHRVNTAYGSATTFACVDCGSQAREWAYDHLDESERIYDSPKGLIAYSTNPAHYMPMCKSCHTSFDRRHAFLARAAA